ITCVVALAANLWLISRFGVTGAAFGILLPYVLQGILRYRALRLVFRWRNPWGDVGHPLLAAVIAGAPAFACRALIDGLTGQVVAAIVFLLIYGGGGGAYLPALAYARRTRGKELSSPAPAPAPVPPRRARAKAAMASFTMTLQLELEGCDIRIIDLQPGDISTEFNDVIAKTEMGHRYATRIEKTWRAVDRNMKAAPKPDLVARRIAKLIDAANPPPRVTVGDAFQSVIAPIIFRLLPQRIRIWGLKKYYGL